MKLLCFVTCKNIAEARKIAKTLLKKRLVACANIVPKIESHYWWKGKMEQGSEAMLILKTRKELKPKVLQEIEKMHSYKLPVVEFIEAKASKAVEKWIEKETK